MTIVVIVGMVLIVGAGLVEHHTWWYNLRTLEWCDLVAAAGYLMVVLGCAYIMMEAV